jgi:hypothetical protein
MKFFRAVLIVGLCGFGLMACGQETSTEAESDSNNWYDTDGTGGPSGGDSGATDSDKPDSGDKPDYDGDKPDTEITPGLSWDGDVNLSTASGTINLTNTDESLNVCATTATVAVEDYTEDACEGCSFQAGLRFGDIVVDDTDAPECADLLAMSGARLDVGHGDTLVIEYAGINYYTLFEMNASGEFVEMENGYSALVDESQWILGNK